MDYSELISKAIKNDDVVELLRGNGEYEVAISEFTSDVFPTEINAVLVNCFYKQKDSITNIERIFNDALDVLIEGSASDIYTAMLYFDACIFQEERGKASFLIDKEGISKKLQASICKEEAVLRDSIVFGNGMKKTNPWKNIENFNKYYEKKYGIHII